METIRIYLCAMALVLSIGGAAATSFFADQNPVYQFFDAPGTEDDACVAVSLTCGTNYSYPCKVCISGPTLRNSFSPAVQCGIELTRETPPAACFSE